MAEAAPVTRVAETPIAEAGATTSERLPAGAAAGNGTWSREPHTVVLHQASAPTSVPGPFAILVESAVVPVPLEFESHSHPLHELVWVQGGTMTVRLPDRVITVPEGQGLWIPANTMHSGRTTAGSKLFDALFEPERSPAGQAEVFSQEAMSVEVTPLVAALLTHLQRTDLAEGARMRAESVVFDVLEPAAQQLSLRVPYARYIAPIVEALIEDPMNDRALGEWAGTLGASERTIARLFRAHTGLSFQQWRQSLRVHRALELLGEGHSVQDTSDQLGYSHPSTFIASFKRVMGVTPGGYGSAREE